MIKLKTICFAVLTALILSACSSNDGGDDITTPDPKSAAYLSLKVLTPSSPASRASSEEPATADENALKTVKAVVFNSNFDVIKHSTVSHAVQSLSGFNTNGAATTENTNAFKIPGDSKYLLLIANPGAKVDAVLSGITEGMHFNNINNAITAADKDEIAHATNGFTMINSGTAVDSDTDAQSAAKLALVALDGYVKVVGEGAGQYADEAAAKAAAEGARVSIKIERLASKVEVKEVSGGVDFDPVKNPDAKFTFTSWLLDVKNTTFYPWAKKVNLASAPGSGSFYSRNFYTIDPNYEGNTGIVTNAVDVAFPTGAAVAAPVYAIENTMKATAQHNENATRAVVKAAYYPKTTWTGDWFSYGGSDYETLAIMQAAYAVTPANVNLKSACDRFYTKVKAINPTIITAGNFSELTQAMLDALNITDGGEKVEEVDCIRWYQKGLCYYAFPLRHDDAVTATAGFGKYGIVRNNWYVCTVTKVSEAGTPWYPRIDPGPIDETEGYISASIVTAPWVKWSHNVEF